MIQVIYHPDYNRSGIDLRKTGARSPGRIWAALMRRYGAKLLEMHRAPTAPLSLSDLRRVHSDEYLDRLRSSRYLAEVLDSPLVATVPARVTDLGVLRAMRWAAAGTVMGAREALSGSLVFNLGGGYNAAGPASGAAGNVYADVALAIHTLRDETALAPSDTVACIDLGAGAAQGLAEAMAEDSRVGILDIYNSDIAGARKPRSATADCLVPVTSVTASTRYMHLLRDALPGFLDQLAGHGPLRLAIVHLGADAYLHDPRGGLSLTADAVLMRDQAVIAELRRRGIPVLIVPGVVAGKRAHRIIANTIDHCLQRYAAAPASPVGALAKQT